MALAGLVLARPSLADEPVGRTVERAPPVPTAPASEPGAAPAAATATDGAAGAPAAASEPQVVRVQGERALPGAASATTREGAVLRAAPHRTAADLLLVVPGVSITQHSGEGKAYQIFFRGFDAIHGQDVEMWAGGAPVNEVSNLHGQGYADLHFLMPEVVREIASTPGSYDPRQGDFAVAGTLRLSLGYTDPGVTAKVGVGTFGTRRYFLGYHPEGGDDETFAAFEVHATDGFGPARAARRTSAVAQYAHSFDGGLRVRALATVYAGRFDSAGVLLLDDVDRGRVDRFATYDPNQGGDSSRTQLVVEASSQSGTARWSIAPYVVLRELRLRSDFTGYLTSASGDSIQQTNDTTTAGFTASYRTKQRLVSSRDLIEIGVAGRADRVEQTQRTLAIADGRITSTEVDAKVRAHDATGYLDVLLYPLRRLALRGGVRFDGLFYSTREATGQERSSQGVHLGKKATAEYVLLPGLSAALSYGEGFRSPQARSLGNGQTTPFTTVVSTEAGVRYRDEHLRGSLAVFRTTLGDDLVFDQSLARNERTPATLRQGIAAEMVARAAPWFTSSLSLTYTHASFREGDATYDKGSLVPYVPQLVGRADLAFEPRLGQIAGRTLAGQLGGGLTLFHNRPLPYGETGHDALVVDLRAGLGWGPLRLTLDITNALDARWFDGEFVYASRFDPGRAASLVPRRHVTVGPPRTELLSLAITI